MQSKDIFSDAHKNIKILDAGAGTGIIGEMLIQLGYKNIDALDISKEMLDLAAKKNVYKRLICAPLSDVHIDEIQTGEYDVTLCAGTIVCGQAKPVALDECVRHVRPGTVIVSRSFDCHGRVLERAPEFESSRGLELTLLRPPVFHFL